MVCMPFVHTGKRKKLKPNNMAQRREKGKAKEEGRLEGKNLRSPLFTYLDGHRGDNQVERC